MKHKTIWVTGIGGNVGQGILRNIKAYYPEIKIIGSNISRVSSGNYWVDEVEVLPYAWESSFQEKCLDLVKRHRVDLILPSTDFEVYYLSRFSELLPPVVACPEYEASIFLDKMKTFRAFKKHAIPFAKSFEVHEFKKQVKRYLAKPKQGRGSRGLLFQPLEWHTLGDEYMIQEWEEGEEITTAFYVTKNNDIHGHITMKRVLQNGTTMECEVSSDYNNLVLPIIQSMVKNFNLIGCINIQSIVTEKKIVPFEINARISGTNSIRSQFGFHDIKYAIQEYLLNEKPDPVAISNGSALRVVMDIIYPNQKIDEIRAGSFDAHLF